MREFVSNHYAGGAEVDAVIHGLVKERGLQNSSGKHDLVIRTVVVGVHRRRSHAPLFPIDWLADLSNVPARFELICTKEIAHQIALLNRQLAVIAPDVWISDLISDCLQLDLRLFLCLLGHPRQSSDVLIERLL